MLAALSGCARMWFAEREPWRREAEVACLQSGAVKESPYVAIVSAIDGPGVCGADYPLRVSALGEAAVPGFAEEVPRPPGAIQAGSLHRHFIVIAILAVLSERPARAALFAGSRRFDQLDGRAALARGPRRRPLRARRA